MLLFLLHVSLIPIQDGGMRCVGRLQDPTQDARYTAFKLLKPSALSKHPATGFASQWIVCSVFISSLELGWSVSMTCLTGLVYKFKSNFLCAVNKVSKRHFTRHAKKCVQPHLKGGVSWMSSKLIWDHFLHCKSTQDLIWKITKERKVAR